MRPTSHTDFLSPAHVSTEVAKASGLTDASYIWHRLLKSRARFNVAYLANGTRDRVLVDFYRDLSRICRFELHVTGKPKCTWRCILIMLFNNNTCVCIAISKQGHRVLNISSNQGYTVLFPLVVTNLFFTTTASSTCMHVLEKYPQYNIITRMCICHTAVCKPNERERDRECAWLCVYARDTYLIGL